MGGREQEWRPGGGLGDIYSDLGKIRPCWDKGAAVKVPGSL